MVTDAPPEMPPGAPPGPPPEPFMVPIFERPAYLARIHIGVTSPLFALAVAALCGRLYLRTRPSWILWVDDWFILGAFGFATSAWALGIKQAIVKSGWYSPEYITSSIKLSHFAIPLWGLCMTCVKVAISLMILRIRNTKAWKIVIYTGLVVQVAYGIGNVFFVMLRCRPLAASWDPSFPESACLDLNTVQIASIVGSSVNIATDLLLSLSPAVFVVKLRRPLRERIMICFLMGLGLLASVASIVKTVHVTRWGHATDDFWGLAMTIATWTVVEMFLSVIAACMPVMKQPLQRLLNWAGISVTTAPTQYGPYISRATGGRHYTFNSAQRNGTTDMSYYRDQENGPQRRFPANSPYIDLDLADSAMEMEKTHTAPLPRNSEDESGSDNLIIQTFDEELPSRTV